MDKRVLIACEESQAVTIEFRKLGITAFSCDIEPCSGGHPEWHIQGDVLPLLQEKWDLIIAFPPCTYLTNAGTRHFSIRMNPIEKVQKRLELREEAFEFFMKFANANCNKIAIENPVGYINSKYRKADQIIHPYFFGDPFMKRTCLWLKNLPLLVPTNPLPKPEPLFISEGKIGKGNKINWVEGVKIGSGCKKQLSKIRSKTFKGIAEAIALQWSKDL